MLKKNYQTLSSYLLLFILNHQKYVFALNIGRIKGSSFFLLLHSHEKMKEVKKIDQEQTLWKFFFFGQTTIHS